MNRKKIVSLLASFLILMLLFTIISRAAGSAGIANVKADTAQSMSIDHTVSGSGKVVQNRDQAVSTQPDQKVKGIYVNEGQSVKKGDLLFDVDLEVLKEQILLKEQEIEKMNLQQGDTESQKNVEQQKKESSKNRAVQDYENAQSKGETAVTRAARALQETQQRLDEFRQSKGQQTSGEDTVAKELEKTCQEKEAAFQEAAKALKELEKKIEQAVTKALAETEEKNKKADGAKAAQKENKTAKDQADQSEKANADRQEKSGADQQEKANADRQEKSGAMQQELEDPAAVEERVRRQFQSELDHAKKAVEEAQSQKETADLAYQQYQQEQSSRQQESGDQQEQQLIDNVTALQQAYDDAVAAREEGLTNAKRAIEDASAPEARDSANRLNELDKQKLLMDLQKLKKLQEDGGRIQAPINGVVTKIAVTTGDRTMDGTAVLMADTSGGVKLTAQIPAEQEKYIAKNDKVIIKTGSSGNMLDGMKVASVRQNDENGDMLDVVILLPEGSLEIGTAAEFEVTRNSKTYQTCVPIQAVQSENNGDFVYILQESDSVLGKETVVQKLKVNVLDKNEKYAALEDGSLTNEQKIVTQSDKQISEGSRVRLVEE